MHLTPTGGFRAAVGARPARALLAAACLVLSLFTAACGQSRPTDFYMLSGPVPPEGSVTLPRTTLGIGHLAVPGYLDRPGVVVVDEKGTSVNVPRFNVWAEPLNQGIRRVVAGTLSGPLLERGVTTLPTGGDSAWTDYALHMEVMRMDADTAGNVLFAARWTLVERATRTSLLRGSFVKREKVSMPPFGSREMFNTMVEAESGLVVQCAEQMAREISAVFASRPRVHVGGTLLEGPDRDRDSRDRADTDRR